jgi:hypothetical protein
MTKPCSSADIADAIACLERLDAATLRAVLVEISRMVRRSNDQDQAAVEEKLVARRKRIGPTTLGSVSLGTRFVYQDSRIFGPEYANTHRQPFDGTIMTVVEFKPRYVNQVLAQDSNGYQCLMRLSDVQKALGITTQVDSDATSQAPSNFGDPPPQSDCSGQSL